MNMTVKMTGMNIATLLLGGIAGGGREALLENMDAPMSRGVIWNRSAAERSASPVMCVKGRYSMEEA